MARSTKWSDIGHSNARKKPFCGILHTRRSLWQYPVEGQYHLDLRICTVKFMEKKCRVSE